MKYLITGFALLASTVVIGGVVLFLVLVVAGPHAGLLPQPLEVVVVILGWAAVFLGPFFVTRTVWRKLGVKRAA